MTIAMALDLGTTAFKGALFDEHGQSLAIASIPTPIDEPRDGWKQITVPVFLDTLRQLIAKLAEQDAAALRAAAALSFATQTNSFTLLDEHDAALTPIVLWNDRRAEPFSDEIDAWWHATGSYAETGLPRMGAAFAVAKCLWWQREDAGLWQRARKFRLIGDVLTHWLTGQHVTEAGAAGLTGLLDIHQLTGRRNAIARLGLQHLAFPQPRYLGAQVGTIRTDVAEALGINPTCRVFLGGLDQYVGAVGAGNTVPGGVSETTGTVLATVRLADRFEPRLAEHAIFHGPTWRPGTYWQMTFGSISANLFESLRRSEAAAMSYDDLVREAQHVAPGADGLRLNPAESLAAGKPVFDGQADHHGRPHRTRAILEGVAYALNRQVDDLAGDAKPDHVRSLGGAARSDFWLQLKADTLGVPMHAMDCAEPTCLGAAAVALAGLKGEPLTDVTARLVRPSRRFNPTPA